MNSIIVTGAFALPIKGEFSTGRLYLCSNAKEEAAEIIKINKINNTDLRFFIFLPFF
jgi:hypothetical protein